MNEKRVKLLLKFLLLLSGITFFVPYFIKDKIAVYIAYWIVAIIPFVISIIAGRFNKNGYNCGGYSTFSFAISIVLVVIGFLLYLQQGQFNLI